MTSTQPEPGIISAPPHRSLSAWAWSKKNLFSTWYNGILTVLCVLFLIWLFSGLISWALTTAQWRVIAANLRLFFAGRYPADDLWRLWSTVGFFAIATGLTWGTLVRQGQILNRMSLGIIGGLAALCLVLTLTVGLQGLLLLGILAVLVVAAFAGQAVVQRIEGIEAWLPLVWLAAYVLGLMLILSPRGVRLETLSGLVLTLLTAVTSIVLCFPFGVLLALGRQSDLPIVRWVCIAFIEVVRGLPLIGILFMAQVMLPLVLTPGSRPPDRVIRAIAGLTIFAAAYLAENVRGGLQAIPRGQREAARALGLSAPLVTLLIVLPQALKAVIPTIVGQFISLFKDTSLLAIVGLVELLGISQSILANPNYLGRHAEVYSFVALIYWVCCYAMSLTSRRLERQLNTGQR